MLRCHGYFKLHLKSLRIINIFPPVKCISLVPENTGQWKFKLALSLCPRIWLVEKMDIKHFISLLHEKIINIKLKTGIFNRNIKLKPGSFLAKLC
jgi:hypothetical protein